MIDQKLLEALAAVIRFGGFERAAEDLGITQSAVSQRVKLLEQRLGRPLVVRSKPLAATDAGMALYRHHQQVSLLENELLQKLPDGGHQGFEKIALAVNADSVATWFRDVARALFHDHRLLIHLEIDDETKTLDYLKHGTVLGAVGTQSEPAQGCRMVRLGTMRYVAVARPDFVAQWFGSGVTPDAIRQAPATIFGKHDDMHTDFLRDNFGIGRGEFPSHTIPTSEGFMDAALSGIAYGLVSELQARDHLAQGRLVNVFPCHFDRTLYFHYWNTQSDLLDTVVRIIRKVTRAQLGEG